MITLIQLRLDRTLDEHTHVVHAQKDSLVLFSISGGDYLVDFN